MKKGRIYFFCTAAAMLLSGCVHNGDTAEGHSSAASVYETAVTSVSAETVKAVTEKSEIKPLSPSKRQAYLRNDEFSIAAELTKLQSSLYYPDIVHELGANPDLFVVTAEVKVKNMTEEEKSFDVTKLSVPDMFFFGGDTEDFKSIKPGKSVVFELRFLCSLEQAADIKGLLYDGEYFEEGEDFYPEEFYQIIDAQGTDDVAEYFYRQFCQHMYKGYFFVTGGCLSYELHHIKGIKADGKNYMTVSYSIYNRSDYANLIDPSDFRVMCGRYRDKGAVIERQNVYMPSGGYMVIRNDTELESLDPLYIIADEKLMYAPQKAELQLEGMGDIYELPEFLSMVPENPTEFTVIYDLGDNDRARVFAVDNSHTEPYYNDMKNFALFDWDVWEEDYFEREEIVYSYTLPGLSALPLPALRLRK